ncbi:MAG: hypothetical protein LBI34_02055 [Puniceicoccales bacterium]|nr:hypothetical protein [Puniceicoccales bacterium]
MPEFKDSAPAEQTEELVTITDFNHQNTTRHRRRHPIGRGGARGKAIQSNNMGPWDGVNTRDMVQERMERMAEPGNPTESHCTQGESKYSTAVVGRPSPHKSDGPVTQRGRHSTSCHHCKNHGENSQKKSCSCGGGILRKVLSAIWPFKRCNKVAGPDGEEKNTCQAAPRQRSGGGRHFRPRNRSPQNRSRTPGA